jgi:(E)-4-hydroxy-3-methylbut-2-enyl-diphosphate synthase
VASANAQRRTSNFPLIHIHISGARQKRSSAMDSNSAGELIRVVVRQANFDKIAHKIDRMGDYKPEIVYEDANISESIRETMRRLRKSTRSKVAQFVTVTDEIDLPVIAAFRLLATKLHGRHPILLKDALKNDEARMANDERNPNDRTTKGKSEASVRASDFVIPSSLDIRHSSFLDTLLTASTNIGSLLCDGIGDAILVQGEQAPGQALRLSYKHFAGSGFTHFQN